MTCPILDSGGTTYQVELTVLDSAGTEWEINNLILDSAGVEWSWCTLADVEEEFGGANTPYPVILTKELREDDELIIRFAKEYMRHVH